MDIRHANRRQGGAAAIELALVLAIFVLVLTLPVFIARVLWHYTVIQKAAQDSARYLSLVSHQEMRDPQLAPRAKALAEQIARLEMADLNPGPDAPDVQVFCGQTTCDGLGSRPLPDVVRVRIEVNMYDFFGAVGRGRYGLPLTVDYALPYLGMPH